MRDGVVDDALEDERRQDADERRQQDRGQEEPEHAAVGAGERPHPPQDGAVERLSRDRLAGRAPNPCATSACPRPTGCQTWRVSVGLFAAEDGRGPEAGSDPCRERGDEVGEEQPRGDGEQHHQPAASPARRWCRAARRRPSTPSARRRRRGAGPTARAITSSVEACHATVADTCRRAKPERLQDGEVAPPAPYRRDQRVRHRRHRQSREHAGQHERCRAQTSVVGDLGGPLDTDGAHVVGVEAPDETARAAPQGGALLPAPGTGSARSRARPPAGR